MMKHIITFLFSLCVLHMQAQTSFDFESSSVPSEWSGLDGALLSIDSQHYKDGEKALKCELQEGSIVQMKLSSAISNSRVVLIPVYSEKVSNDTLIFNHYSEGALSHKGRILLNFKGWRVYHRHLSNDFGGVSLKPYNILHIKYAPETPGDDRTIWLDNITTGASISTAFIQQRIPGLHDILDYRAGQFVGDYTELSYLKASLNKPSAALPSTADEQTDYNKVNQSFSYGESYINGNSSAADARPYLSQAKYDEAKAYVKSLNLTYLENGSISGTGFPFPLNPDTVLTHSFRVLALSYGAQTLQDTEAEDLLIDFTRHLIEQGIAEGGPVYLATSNYKVSRQFFLGFLHALPVIRNNDSTLADEVENLVRYVYNYNLIYGEYEPGLSTDYIHIKAKYLFALAGLRPAIDEKVRDVYAVKTLYENFTYPTEGILDGMKTDGIGYHHDSKHNAYMYAYGTWVTDMNALYNTNFQISEEAYRNLCKFYTSHYLQTANDGNTAYFANASNGRAPFNLTAKVTKSNFNTLCNMGRNYSSNDAYSNMLATYNYFFAPTASSVKDLNGFHQFNSGVMGVYRNSGWTVNMTGLTASIWGTEIYSKANIFGRYQSYGALEVMYNGTNVLGRSGYPTAVTIPWDWNVVPGATTIHLGWKDLAPNKDRADEYQTNSFAGALSAGKEGIFALDFVEKSTHYVAKGLKFKKTVFAFDDILLCLGSGIGATHAANSTATNLFQTVLGTLTGNLYINSEAAAGQSLTTNLDAGEEHWLVNPSGTGYFIPAGNDAVTVSQGDQTVPNHDNAFSSTAFTTTVNQAAKAWIDHGAAPSDKSYSFVVVPATTPTALQQLIPSLRPGAGNYTLIAQQSNGHIVRLDRLNKTAYAIFDQYLDIPDGKVTAVSNPCLLMTDESENGYLTIHISSPNMEETEAAVVIELHGDWELASSSSEDVSLQTVAGQQTRLTVSLYRGEKEEIRLQKKNNSSLHDLTTDAIQVYYSRQDRTLNIHNTGKTPIVSVSLSDISGRDLQRWDAQDKNNFAVGQLLSGVYLANVRLSNGESTTKKIQIY